MAFEVRRYARASRRPHISDTWAMETYIASASLELAPWLVALVHTRLQIDTAATSTKLAEKWAYS